VYKKNTSLAVDLWDVSEIFGTEILNNLNWVKNMLRVCLPLNFIPMKFKELLAEKR